MRQAYVMPPRRRLESIRAWIPCLVFLLFAALQTLAQTSVDPAEGDDAAVTAFVNVAVVSMLDETWLENGTQPHKAVGA